MPAFNSIYKYLLVCILQLATWYSFGQINKTDSINEIQLSPLKINTRYNDYSPLLLKDKIIYCSNGRNTLLPYYSSKSGEMLDRLVIADITGENSYSNAKVLFPGINIKSVQGPASMHPNGKVLYFTGNCVLNEPGCNQSSNKNLKIYTSEYNQEKKVWENIKEFPYNNPKYSVGHPAISADGLSIIFASNQPGGFGKSDLYITHLRNGQWTKPKNLGPKVNTSENELFPYLNKEDKLYFSSNRNGGFGKLDLYSAQLVNTEYIHVKNLGIPFNSDADDFGYTEDPAGYGGFFTSNRTQGRGDDIFRFIKANPACDTIVPFPFCYTFYEEGTYQDENLPLVYEWDFGDGFKKRGLEVSHCFNQAGNYTINLNIIDTLRGNVYFNEASYSLEVEKLNKPHIELVGDLMPNSILELNAEKSSLNNCILDQYFWDFGNGQRSEGISILHVYEQKGDYEISLMIKGKNASNGTECQACVSKKITISSEPKIEQYKPEEPEAIYDISTTIHTIKGLDSLVYKVQVKTSETPLSIDSINFKDLSNVEEYKYYNTYGYMVGAEQSLSSAYPLYLNIKEKGFEEAQIIALKAGGIISGKDTTQFIKRSSTISFAQIQGRIINRYGEPIRDSIHGRFSIILPNEELYGFYAELKGYYSISNFIDLRNEKRNLEINKNIEMVGIKEINEINLTIRLNNIFFDLNESRLHKESYPELNRLADLLKDDPEVKIEISGHTDNSGSFEVNQILSQKRAESVRDYLLYLGIDRNRIFTIGFGDKKPVVSNKSERGRILNRRVEFRLLYD
jgi:outer membrane protein OmpA-like peptidoglycan-associated protein